MDSGPEGVTGWVSVADGRPSQRRARRDALAVGMALLLALVHPAPASAHGGRLAFSLAAGPYAVTAYVVQTGTNVDETFSLTNAATGQPVTAGVVVLTLTRTGGMSSGPFVARDVGGSFEVLFPPPRGGGWNVSADIQGPLGEATVTHGYVAPPTSAAGDWLVSLIVLTAFVVLPFAAYRWWLGPARTAAPSSESGS